MNHHILTLSLFLLLFSCAKEEEPPYVPPVEQEDIYNNHEALSKTFDLSKIPIDYTRVPQEIYPYRTFWDPPFQRRSVISSSVTVETVTLGRVMFYDKNLSADGTISCASCHQRHLGFGDSTTFSTGLSGISTRRNTFPLASYMTYSGHDTTLKFPTYFWDSQQDIYHSVFRSIITDKMGIDSRFLPDKLKEIEYYPILYNRIYSGRGWTNQPEGLLGGLNAFISSMVSVSSPFDEELWRMQHQTYTEEHFTNDFPSFTPSENLGKRLFFANCASCHGRFLGYELDVLFNEAKGRATCNGLDLVYADKGVGAVEDDPSKDGFFKIPSLKNIGVTAPYMHDGRFATLREVVEFYNSGIQEHSNLDSLLRDSKGEPLQLDLNEQEINAMVDFLHTLTDEEFLTDDRWSDPFLR